MSYAVRRPRTGECQRLHRKHSCRGRQDPAERRAETGGDDEG